MSGSFREFIRPHRTVPIMPWTARGRWELSFSRVAILTFGLFIFGLGDALLIQSNLGNTPWSVLAQGISERLDITMGWSTFGIATIVLALWIPLREKPGFGTLLNIIVISIAIQVGVTYFPLQDNFFSALSSVLLGIALVGIGSTLYITCGLGAGPRDGLMVALHNRTGVRIGRVRFGIEGSVLVLGALLGGQVGVGTALFAGLIGQSMAISFGVAARLTAK